MGALIILVAALAVVVVSTTALWVRATRVNQRIIGAPSGGESHKLFRGGMMGRRMLTSGTLVRMEFFDWGVRLGGAIFFRWAIPVWEASYDQIAIAELVTLPHSRITVWLRLRDGQGAIGFLGGDHQEILALLRERGVPVNRVVTEVRRVQELYQ